jgi:hypothetical protein
MEKNVQTEALAALKPKLWHNIVITVLLALITHPPFELMAKGEPVDGEVWVSSILALIVLFFVWFGYCGARKSYMKYKDKI